MKILGISCYFHDASAALLVDGKLVAAAEEERFSRVKHDFDFPENAIKFCLDRGGLSGEDLDYVVFFEKPFVKFDRLLHTVLAGFPKTYWLFVQSLRTWLFEKLWVRSTITSSVGVPKERILFSDHHLSHAASAYLASPFSEAAILTFDGVGEWATTTVGIGSGNNVEILKEIHFPHSIGLLYSAFTAFLGFEVNEGEYKVMGMAPYGTPKYVDRVWGMIRRGNDGSFWLDHRFFSFHFSTSKSFTSRFINLFGPSRPPEMPFFTERTGYPKYFGEKPDNYEILARDNQYYADVAASIQAVTEELVLDLAREAYKATGMTRLCLAGGVAMNSVANGRVIAETPIEELYIQPSAGDGGGALGAALVVWNSALDNDERLVMDHAFWGKEYGPEAISEAVNNSNHTAVHYGGESDLLDAVVDRIENGKVIGWFQGRSEWGPRALGNRSILADPRREAMKDLVNTKIKFREPFRPFAPSVLAERCAEFFDLPDPESSLPARFMLVVVPVLPNKIDVIPAVSHMGTARVQTVHKETSPRFHRLVERFGDRTGVPVLLNTSFNLRGEPIVESPTDALTTFDNSGLDCLVLGDYVIDKLGEMASTGERE